MSVIIDKMNKAIQTGGRQAVIAVLTNICTVDPSFSSGYFDEALKHAEDNYGKDKLYVDYNEGDLFDNSSVREDFSKAVVAMENNFCETRVNATRTLGIRLYREVGGKTEEEKKSPPPQGTARPMEEKRNWGLLLAIILLLILGVGIGVSMIVKNLK